MSTSDRSSSPASPDEPGAHDATVPERRYDSFHVRVWYRSNDPTLLRVEVQHLQTGLVETAAATSPSWIIETILLLLGMSPRPGDSSPPRA